MSSSAPPASTRVYDHVKHHILDGTLPGGEFFTEGAVAEQTGLSRTPVREALLRLEVEGLVRLYPKKGALVLPVTADEARHVLEARSVIEHWAAGAMWERREEVLPALREQLEAMRAARGAGDVTRFVEQDRAFHEVIVTAAGNPILSRTYHALRDRQVCIIVSQMRMSADRIDSAVAGHSRLVEILRDGTHEEFLAETDDHLSAARARLRGL